MKIIEWNINHRLGFGGKDMPTWIKDVIEEKEADIVVLTETSFNVPNWEKVYRDLFKRDEYYTFCSNNIDVNQNDVTIAIKKEHFNVEWAKSFLSEGHIYPDHLEVHCIHKETNRKIVIIGMRIHADATKQQRKNEFINVLQSVVNYENVMIIGDFNNYRRGFINKEWCLTKVKELADSHKYVMYTPFGGSIYCDDDGKRIFPEDHIFTRGPAINILKYDYDRSFVSKDERVYIWGKNFQKYMGNNIYDSINPPYPDHAIIEVDFEIK